MRAAQIGNHQVQYNADQEFLDEIAEMGEEQLRAALVDEREEHGAWELLCHAIHD